MARLRPAVRRTAVATAIASGLLLPACAISFDGYKLGPGDASAGSGGSSGSGGTATGGAGGTTAGGAGGTTTGGAGGTTTGGTGGAGATGGTGGTGPSCPTGLSGPSMVYVPVGNKGFCIDSTEVTNKQYQSFLKANLDPSQQIGSCSWNSSFAANTSGACSPSPYDPSGKANYPISCVNWCDAVAYCKWAKKRLCGQIGGGSNNTDHSADATYSQWYAACSEQGKRAFPYGSAYQDQYCNGVDYLTSITTIPVEQANLCVGGYDGIYDMSGNVSEWEDSCTGSNQTAQCLYRGGGYLDHEGGTSNLRCDSAPFATVTATAPTRGFRCCYDP